MCKGPSTQTVQNVSQPPPQFMNAYQNVVNSAFNLSSRGYQPYGGQMVAGFTPDQQQAMQAIMNLPGQQNGAIATAANNFNAASAPLSIDQFSPGAVQQYESPFTQQVVQATQQQFQNLNQQQQEGIVSNAVNAGAFGGDRTGVAQGIVAGQQAAQEAPVLAQLENQGYSQALQEFNQQQQAKLGAQEAQRWLESQTGFGFANLAQEAQNMNEQAYAAALGVGGMEQQLQQEQLNIPYYQFEAAQAYPFQEESWLANIVEGTGGLAGGTSMTTQPGPSPLSQGVGTAMELGSTAALLALALRKGGRVKRPLGGMIPGISVSPLPPIGGYDTQMQLDTPPIPGGIAPSQMTNRFVQALGKPPSPTRNGSGAVPGTDMAPYSSAGIDATASDPALAAFSDVGSAAGYDDGGPIGFGPGLDAGLDAGIDDKPFTAAAGNSFGGLDTAVPPKPHRNPLGVINALSQIGALGRQIASGHAPQAFDAGGDVGDEELFAPGSLGPPPAPVAAGDADTELFAPGSNAPAPKPAMVNAGDADAELVAPGSRGPPVPGRDQGIAAAAKGPPSGGQGIAPEAAAKEDKSGYQPVSHYAPAEGDRMKKIALLSGLAQLGAAIAGGRSPHALQNFGGPGAQQALARMSQGVMQASAADRQAQKEADEAAYRKANFDAEAKRFDTTTGLARQRLKQEGEHQQRQDELGEKRLSEESSYHQGELGLRHEQLGEESAYHQGELGLRGRQIGEEAAYHQGELGLRRQGLEQTGQYQQGELGSRRAQFGEQQAYHQSEADARRRQLDLEGERLRQEGAAGTWSPGYDPDTGKTGMVFTPRSGGPPQFHPGISAVGKETGDTDARLTAAVNSRANSILNYWKAKQAQDPNTQIPAWNDIQAQAQREVQQAYGARRVPVGAAPAGGGAPSAGGEPAPGTDAARIRSAETYQRNAPEGTMWTAPSGQRYIRRQGVDETGKPGLVWVPVP